MKTLTLAPFLALALAGTAVAQTTMNVRDADIRAFIAEVPSQTLADQPSPADAAPGA